MKIKNFLMAIIVSTVTLCIADNAVALRPSKAKKAPNVDLAVKCPAIRQVGGDMFYKNNKPIRASSAFAAPVIGYNRVMTFAYGAGRKGPLGGSAKMYDKDGGLIASMRGYPCRPDHCGGRVVSSLATSSARRKAVSATKSPEGFITLSSKLCIRIPDIGACYNAKKRGPCAGIVK